ncbi:LacI family DNA-binding transcriptional regulator [Antarctobacter jejuensis]|uniref:LacI family DNA-binding transcriptional regulator n=1 Tax=Antarctobacter jejuensis TaxID=1439938 RepID=UPI003FD3FD39
MTSFPFKKRSNLRDVAALAGVSVATVSRVLNDKGKVSGETRRRVQDAMAELKFVPSAAARAINSGRSRMVAALLPTLDNSIYSRVVNGLENRLDARGLSLLVAQTGDDPATELDRARKIVDIGAEALIVAGVSHDTGLYDLMERAQMPVVAVSYFDPDHRLPTVGYDNAEAIMIAARHLAELGHKEIAVVHGPARHNDRIRRRIEVLNAAPLGLNIRYLEVPAAMEGGHVAVERLIDAGTACTAVLCFSDIIAHGALAALARRGIAVPHQMSVMGIENLPGSHHTCPGLTSVRLSLEEMGREAAEAVAHWLETGHRPAPVRMQSELILRESTAHPPQS